MVVSYPSRPGIFQNDPFASFQQGYSFTKGIRNERDAVDAFGQYADTLYGPKTNEPHPSLAALGQVLGTGNPAFNGSSAEVPQTALAAADALGAGTTQPINAYMASVRGAESRGNNLARNPRSTATGPYQFLEGTWNDLARKYPDLGLTPDGRTDPVQNERAMQAFTRENARMLAGQGIPVNPGNLYAAHFLGAGGASSVLKQPDTGLIASYLPPEVVAANPHLQGMTVADFRQWASKQGDGPSGGYAAPQMAGIPNGGFPSPRPVEQRSVLPPRDVMMALFRSPDTRQLAISLAQAAQSGQPIEQFQTFQREDGSVWQMNTQTGEMSVLQQGAKPPEPEGLMSVAPGTTVFDPNTGQPVFTGPQQDKPQPRPLSPEERVRWGIPETDTRPYALGANGMPEVIGGSGQTINVNTDPGVDGALNKALSEAEGKQWSEYKSAGTVSAANAQDFQVLDELIGMAPQGAVEGRLAQAFPGFNSAGDAFQSIVKRIAPTLRAPGSGSTSDIEYAGMLQSLPGLQNSPEANRMILSIMKAKAEINQRRSETITRYQTGEIDIATARREMNELDRASILTPEMRQALVGIGGSGEVNQAVPNVGDVVEGYRFKGGNPADQNSWEKV